MMRMVSLAEDIAGDFASVYFGPTGGGLGEPYYNGRTADESKPPGWTPDPAAWDPSYNPNTHESDDPFYSALSTAARQTQEPWIVKSEKSATRALLAFDERSPFATDAPSSSRLMMTVPTTILAGQTRIDQVQFIDGTLYNHYQVSIDGVTWDAYVKAGVTEPDGVILVRVPESAAAATGMGQPPPAGGTVPTTSSPEAPSASRGAQPSSASRGGESLRTAGQPSFAGRFLNDFGERLLDGLSALPASPLSIYHDYKTGKAMYEAYVKEKSFGAGFLMAVNVLNPLYHAEVARFQASEAADRGDYGEATGYGIQAALGYIQTLFLAVGIKNGLTSPVAGRFFRTGGGVGGGTLKPQLESALPATMNESLSAEKRTFLENDVDVGYGAHHTRLGNDWMTIRVTEARQPWPGFFDVVVHAESEGRTLSPGIASPTSSRPLQFYVEQTHVAQIAEAIKWNPNLKPGQPIRMLSCALNPVQAQELANLTGHPIFASPFVVGVESGTGEMVVQQYITRAVADGYQVEMNWLGKYMSDKQVWNVYWPF